MKRITKKQSRPAREFADNLIKYLRENLKEKYIFDVRLVGSVKWNTIIKVNNKLWDIDYQILLSNNSQVYKNNQFNNPTKIKEDFFNCFNVLFNKKNGFTVQNSTTAITIINKNAGYSFDFVIIKNGSQIIRRNNNDGSGKNIYTWNQLPKYSKAYDKFKNLSPIEKEKLIEDRVLPRKEREMQKNDGDPTKKSSYEIFIEEINNYVTRKRNH